VSNRPPETTVFHFPFFISVFHFSFFVLQFFVSGFRLPKPAGFAWIGPSPPLLVAALPRRAVFGIVHVDGEIGLKG
jgi:hypothetical protein